MGGGGALCGLHLCTGNCACSYRDEAAGCFRYSFPNDHVKNELHLRECARTCCVHIYSARSCRRFFFVATIRHQYYFSDFFVLVYRKWHWIQWSKLRGSASVWTKDAVCRISVIQNFLLHSTEGVIAVSLWLLMEGSCQTVLWEHHFVYWEQL